MAFPKELSDLLDIAALKDEQALASLIEKQRKLQERLAALAAEAGWAADGVDLHPAFLAAQSEAWQSWSSAELRALNIELARLRAEIFEARRYVTRARGRALVAARLHAQKR